MLMAFLLAAALPVSTPVPGALGRVDAWIRDADAAAKAGKTSDAAANLWRAAEAADHDLRDYPRAVELYDRLVLEYPAARLSRGAALRRHFHRLQTPKPKHTTPPHALLQSPQTRNGKPGTARLTFRAL